MRDCISHDDLLLNLTEDARVKYLRVKVYQFKQKFFSSFLWINYNLLTARMVTHEAFLIEIHRIFDRRLSSIFKGCDRSIESQVPAIWIIISCMRLAHKFETTVLILGRVQFWLCWFCTWLVLCRTLFLAIRHPRWNTLYLPCGALACSDHFILVFFHFCLHLFCQVLQFLHLRVCCFSFFHTRWIFWRIWS